MASGLEFERDKSCWPQNNLWDDDESGLMDGRGGRRCRGRRGKTERDDEKARAE